jgi:RHS repeat-associated protein
MSKRRPSLRERLNLRDRRRNLARKPEMLERLESKSLISEPINMMTLAGGLSAGLALLSKIQAGSPVSQAMGLPLVDRAAQAAKAANRVASAKTVVGDGLTASLSRADNLIALAIVPSDRASTGGGSGDTSASASPAGQRANAGGDWLTLTPTPANSSHPDVAGSSILGSTASWQPAARTQGQLIGPRGGSGSASTSLTSTRGAISPLSVPAPSGASNPTLLAAAGAGSATPAPPGGPHGAPAPPAPSAAHPSSSSQTPLSTSQLSGGGVQPGQNPGPTLQGPLGPSQGQFTYFPLYVIDNNDGQVLFPGVTQLGTWSTHMDLRAQVRGTAVSSYHWDTTNLINAGSLSATNTYKLTFTWSGSQPQPEPESVTLSVTDVNSHIETFTYDFLLPAGSGSTSGGSSAPTWPTSLPPSQVLSQAPGFDSHNVSVDATSGALDTSINLPSYNPNVPALALTYDSLTADPRPIVTVPHTLDDTQTVPTKTSGQITVTDTSGVTKYTGSTWYYGTNAGQFIPGDIQQIALQADATSLATGRYNYTATVIDYRATNTTFTPAGTMSVLNNSSSTFGDGWTLQGLEKITSASGGVILDLGDGGRSLWFKNAASGGGFTDQAGEFSTLTGNGVSGYTRTLTDGTQITFDSSGRETATIDTVGLHITFSYDSGGNLVKITDPYGNSTTLTYSAGYLQSIKDPANRLTTFTHTGANLTGATLPDNSTLGYGYDASGRLTHATDANSHIVTVAYDSAERASTVTRPDNSVETFVSDQERGWTNSGTSGSPAAATLLAEARSTYTDPNGNVTDLRPDWYGLGLTDVAVDPLGNVAIRDGNANGLATIAVDRLNRIDQYAYDTKGNITKHTYPDLNTDQYTYNSYAEIMSHTDANNNTYTYTYDGGNKGELVGIKDPLNNLTTLTYTANGRVQTVVDPNNHTTSYQYDAQDRAVTVTNADNSTVLYGYNSQGNATSVTDERSHATTFSFDAMNRPTGSTDSLTNRTTLTYDSGGNLTVQQLPTPVGQTARTTTYQYDSMDRVTTITAPLSRVTVYGYDSGGNLTKITDPMSRVTSIAYDADNRPTVVTAPLTAIANAVTTTTYDAEGQVVQVKDPLGRITTTAYTSRGQVYTVTDPLGNTTTYAYTPTGKTSTITDPHSSGGSVNAFTYDKDDRVVTYTDPLSHSTQYGYDSGGNQTSVTDANGNTTTYLYDSRNRLTTVTDALGHSTVYGYDSGGNQQTVKDALGNVTTTLYDALNRATTITDPRGSVTTMAYDAASRMIRLTDPDGNHTTWGYDSADRMASMTDPLGHSASYVYNNDDQLTDTTDRNGRRVTYSYDSGGRQTGETWVGASPSEIVTNTYDADNELTNAKDSFATLTFTYDSGGNLQTAATSGPGTGQPGVTLTYGYDQFHNRTSIADSLSSQGLTTLQYDNAYRLTTITTSYGGTSGPQVVFGYDSGNRLTSESRTIGNAGTAVNTSLVYDNANRLGTITHQTGGGTALAAYVYAYDNANRLTTETIGSSSVTYTYDHASQLTAAGGARTESYTYDSGGNRSGGGYTVGTGNELTASTGVTYSYDNEENIASQTNTSTHVTNSYTYDYRNRLTAVTVGGTVVATYTYDALDRRIGFKDNGTQTWTVYNGNGPDDNPYADFNSSATLLNHYLSGPAVDEIFARTSSGGTSAWYLTDHLGSVRNIVDASGNYLDTITYDSFGNVLSESNGTNGDRFKFAGMEYDAAIGQYFDHARWYGSVPGRFLEQDPLGFAAGDSNLYGYVRNRATNAIDRAGMAENDRPGSDDNPIGRVTDEEFYRALQVLLEIEEFKKYYKYLTDKGWTIGLQDRDSRKMGYTTDPKTNKGALMSEIYARNEELSRTKYKTSMLYNVITHEMVHAYIYSVGNENKHGWEQTAGGNESYGNVRDYMDKRFPVPGDDSMRKYRDAQYAAKVYMDLNIKAQEYIDGMVRQAESRTKNSGGK